MRIKRKMSESIGFVRLFDSKCQVAARLELSDSSAAARTL
jgi:hypothetical protein